MLQLFVKKNINFVTQEKYFQDLKNDLVFVKEKLFNMDTLLVTGKFSFNFAYLMI